MPALPCIVRILRALVTTRLVGLRILLRGRLQGICRLNLSIYEPNLEATVAHTLSETNVKPNKKRDGCGWAEVGCTLEDVIDGPGFLYDCENGARR